jgi:hypothetical protein
MSGLRLRWKLVLAVLVVAGFTAPGAARAQGDEWSLLVTPQIWVTHIESNGFNAANGSDTLTGGKPLFDLSSKHADGVSPQWGIQVAAQKGRWTLSGAFQYVSFETDATITAKTGLSACLLFVNTSTGIQCAQPTLTGEIPKGFSVGKEHLDTTRMDMDFAATYFIPDVIKDRMDLTVGGGFKFIYATTSRQFEPKVLTFTDRFANPPLPFQAAVPLFYFLCHKDDGSDCVRRDRVTTKDYFYGATIPIGLVNHLSSDGRWLLPIGITPFLGVENRDDRDVAYALTPDLQRIKRIDGIKFAYGGTLDITLRHAVTDNVSMYAGMRGQYIKGHEEYLAYGPIVGMSVRFGGR